MFKKLASVALAALMVTGTAAISANAAVTEEAVAAVDESAVAAADDSAVGADAASDTGADPKVYFEVPSFWQNFKDIRIYLYKTDSGDVMIPWNSKKGKMTDEKNGKWSFDLAKKGYTLDSKTNYACIFLTDNETQTCDIFIGNPCLGDTAYCTGENNKIENTADSHKKNYEVKWKNADASRWGVPLSITSIGNVVGSALGEGQTKYGIFVKFLKDKGTSGIDNALNFNGKTAQKTIDDTAKILGLKLDDVKKAIKESGRTDLKWDESKSSLEKGSSGGGSSSGGDDSSSSGGDDSSSSGGGSSSSGGGSSSGGSSSGGSSSGGSSSGGSSSGGSSSGGSTGSVTSGQETTIFFVFGGVMLAAAGVIFLARKRREF